MGLDMYLSGRRSYFGSAQQLDEEGFKVEAVMVELGYWRKHADLHGYIVKEFADGVDECQEIELTEGQIHQIMMAIDAEQLPSTDGFFFRGYEPGSLSKEQVAEMKQQDLEVWTRALGFLAGGLVLGEHNTHYSQRDNYGSTWRTVIYRASW